MALGELALRFSLAKMKLARESLSRLQVEDIEVKDAIAVARAIREGGGHLAADIMERFL
jgi:hypothetical protein